MEAHEGTDMKAHDDAVAAIEASVRKFSNLQQPFRIYHGSTNSTRDSQRHADDSVDTSKLNRVLHIDKERRTALVEPNVPMDDFVRATLSHDLIPLVVMEFPGITVGGGFSGTSGESSSFRSGFFDTTVNWIEIVLARGETAIASKEERSDVFWGAASSFGSLGVVTLLEVQLRDAAPWVALKLLPFTNMDEASRAMQDETAKESTDYLDGIVYSRDRIVLCSGSLTHSLPTDAKVRRFTRRQDPWFYLHVQSRTTPSSPPSPPFSIPTTIHVPLTDYLFRYDRGGFWIARYAFSYFLAPFNRATRFLLDRFLHTRVMYHALHASGQSRRYIIQDVLIPYANAQNFLAWLDDALGIYPLWLCPVRQLRENRDPRARRGLYGFLAAEDTPEYMLNFGVWGPGSTERKEFVRQNRQLEEKVASLQGRKWLYAHAYYTEEEFWAGYDREGYDALRAECGAMYLPSVYDKVRVDPWAGDEARRATYSSCLVDLFWGIWPLSGLYGVYKAWFGGDYLLRKNRERRFDGLTQGLKRE